MITSSESVAHQPVYLKEYQPSAYLIESVDLTFWLAEKTEVTSKLKVIANPAYGKRSSNLILVGETLILKSVTLEGILLDNNRYQLFQDSLTILDVPPSFMLEIVTEINPATNTALSGLYQSNGMFCTQCEAQGFRRITYFLDRPDVMSRYKVLLIADQKKYPILLSNGNLIASGSSKDGTHWVKWEDPFKKPSYLFALVAGQLDYLEDFFVTRSGKRVLLRIYTEPSDLNKCRHAMGAVKKAMRWDEEQFNREYDLDIYMLVAVHDFNMGAMENKGLNIFNTKYILATSDMATDEDFVHVESVIAHEYFHNWSGNRVTCRDWFQLSLKEGLTIFRDQCFTADTTSPTVARIQDVIALRTTQFLEDAGPLAHPVLPDSYIEIDNFYTATVYNKGAEIIRMMKTILGEVLFHQGMDLYFERHDGQAVTIEDFVCVMEDISGIDLAQFRLWYHQVGTPVLEVTDSYDTKTESYTLSIEQVYSKTHSQSPLHIPVKIGLLDEDGKELTQTLLEVRKKVEIFKFPHIAARPVLSLLRSFSAPVKAYYHYSNSDLVLLFKKDTDPFNRWEAGQKYMASHLRHLITGYQNRRPIQIDKDFSKNLNDILQNIQDDKLLLAELLMLPGENYLAEEMKVIDVDAIHEVREYVLGEIGNSLKEELLIFYKKNRTDFHTEQFNFEEMGKRRFKNLCLFYLMRIPNTPYKMMALDQFNQSLPHNMTDTLAALRCLSHIDCPERLIALNKFYDKWQKNALAVDKWLTIQAESILPGTLQQVEQLFHHPAFDIKNPNKVYALIGSFCFRNGVRFHQKLGDGYKLLTDILLELDKLNSNVAARMVKSLTDWRRYDEKRQQLIQIQLERILANPQISKGVYEIVSKSLEKKNDSC